MKSSRSSTPGERKRRKIVVGATYPQFRNWLYENKLSRRDAVFVDGWEKVLGLEIEEGDIVRLGPTSERLESILRTRIR